MIYIYFYYYLEIIIMFTWDGTDVTDLISRCDIFGAKFNRLNYWVIQPPQPGPNKTNEPAKTIPNKNNEPTKTIPNKTITEPNELAPNKIYQEICIVRSSKSTLPCVVDELKEVFGLTKLGTHWCRLNGKTYILIKCIMTPEGDIKEEITLNILSTNNNDISQLLKLQVQEIFAFRELLGVTCSYESSIIIRKGKCGLYPISFYEPNMATIDTKVIPFTVLDKWFDETLIDNVVKRLCKIQSIDNLAKVLHNLRTEIEKIIERVDRRAITYKSCIIDRITQRLQTSLN